MTQFQKKGFEKTSAFLTPLFSVFLQNYFATKVQNDPSIGGDDQAPNSHAVYGDPAFDVLMAMSTPEISKIVGKYLIPQYSYARIYKKGSILEKHIDRPECEYSVTLSLGGEFKENWPIWIKDYDDNKHAVGLDQGDILVYHGTELEHWRDKFEGEKQYQVFMHYVDGEGKFKDRVFDGRSNLGLRK